MTLLVSAPKRIQRRRTEGWRMPTGAIYVGRPGRWGNPFEVIRSRDGWVVADPDGLDYSWSTQRAEMISYAVNLYEAHLRNNQLPQWEGPGLRHLRALTGHDLACWCPILSPCHGDVLLELANGTHDG